MMKVSLSILGLCVLGSALFFFSPKAPAQTPTPSNLPAVNAISVTGYQLISEKRISRTVSEFTYRVSVRNTGPALIVVSGRASASSSAITFPDNTTSFGDIASGTQATSADTFTMRQDRSVPFTVNQLAWQFTGVSGDGVPPDPGAANDLTLAGIDSDNDGVRDDTERYIAVTYPNSAKARAVLRQQAIVNNVELTIGSLSPQQALIAAAQQEAATACGWYVYGESYRSLRKPLLSQFLNTKERWQAYAEWGNQLAGQVSPATIDPAHEDRACAIDPASLPN